MSEVSDTSNQAKVINIDQLEKEIGNAEYYLGKSSGTSLKKETVVSSTSISRSSFDDKRRADILLQFGRVPLDQSSSGISSSNTVAPRSSLSDSRPDSPKRNNALSKSTPSLTNSKYADPNEREKLVMRLLSDHAIKRNQQSLQQSSSTAVQSPARNSPKQSGGGGGGSSSFSFSPSGSGRSPSRIPFGASGSSNNNSNSNNNIFPNRAGSAKQSVSSEINFTQTIDASNFGSNSNSPMKSSAGGVVDGKDLSPDSMDENDPSENSRSIAYSDDEENSQNNSGLLFFASDLVDKSSHDKAYSDLNLNWESFPSTLSNNNGSNTSQISQSKPKDAYMNSTIRNPSRDSGLPKHRYSNDSSIGNEDPSMMETMKWPSASDANRRSVSPPYGLSSSKEIVNKAVISKERPRSAPSRRGAAAQQGKIVTTLDDAALETRARTTEWKYLKSRDALKKEADESFNKEHVFKPQLVAEYNSVTLARRNPSSRMDEIRSRYHESLINREKRKKEEERLGMLEYTGKPQITKRADEIMKKREVVNNERRARDDSNVSIRPNKDVAERLHEDAHARIVTQEYLKKSVDEARRTQYPFQPSLNPKNEAKVSPDYKPIYERISNVQKEKQYRLHQLKAELEDEQTELTFAPKIDAKSAQIVKLKANAAASSSASGVESAEHILNRHKDFGARLMQESIMLSKHRQKLIEDQERREAEMMQPPKVSKGSEAIAARRQEIQTPFDKRLEIYEEKSKLNSNRIRQDVDNEGASWFKPSILAKSEKIVYKIQPGRENESPGQRDKRLSQWDALAIEQKKKMLEEELYGNIKFAPTIDQKSKEMVRKTDFRELVENHRGKRIKDTVRQKVEEMRGADCPFKPKITDYFEKAITKENVSHQILENELRHFGYNDCPTDVYDSHNRESNIDDPARKANLMSRVTINLKQPERMAGNIRHYLQEKEEKRRQALIERELDELRDCTFQPEVDPYAFKRKDSYLSEEPIIVRGLGRHLELKNRSQKLKEDAEAREREVFSVRNVDKIRRPEDGSTIIEPFSFSEISFRPSRAVEELIALEQSHLTYKPDTLEHRRQELIRRHTALMT